MSNVVGLTKKKKKKKEKNGFLKWAKPATLRQIDSLSGLNIIILAQTEEHKHPKIKKEKKKYKQPVYAIYSTTCKSYSCFISCHMENPFKRKPGSILQLRDIKRLHKNEWMNPL